jgi:hypothetical protein
VRSVSSVIFTVITCKLGFYFFLGGYSGDWTQSSGNGKGKCLFLTWVDCVSKTDTSYHIPLPHHKTSPCPEVSRTRCVILAYWHYQSHAVLNTQQSPSPKRLELRKINIALINLKVSFVFSGIKRFLNNCLRYDNDMAIVLEKSFIF